jgi:hypothetical protein
MDRTHEAESREAVLLLETQTDRLADKDGQPPDENEFVI